MHSEVLKWKCTGSAIYFKMYQKLREVDGQIDE